VTEQAQYYGFVFYTCVVWLQVLSWIVWLIYG